MVQFISGVAANTASVLASLSTSRIQVSESSYAAGDVIRRDFALIGGGAAGTYAALDTLSAVEV